MMSESIFEILTTASVGPEAAFDRQLRYRFWELLAQTRTPVSLDELTQALGCERWQVEEALGRYPEAEYDPSGYLVGLGLTLRPTAHQFFLEAQSFSTWCAPDALVMPVVLRRPARISSTCLVTGARIEVRLSPERLERLSPASAVVSFMKQRNQLRDLKQTRSVRHECCNHQWFFASQEVAAPWAVSHADFLVLPVEEAFVGLRDFVRQQMT